ncbi:TPA: hypothetical protein ACNVU8_003608 [Acinetobacter baumannii]|uniref:hypothetical protein n=1 Tax=Acinetobacter pittii TaxID=48296 RepID=UPI00301642C1
MDKSASALSIMFIGLILLFLIFSILSIFYFYWGDLKAIQNSLSTTGSIFSAIATLGAAAVAVYLFNDWKEQAIYNAKKEHADAILEVLSILRYSLIEKIDIVNGLKKVKEFAVINSYYNEYNKENDNFIKSEIFKKTIHINYFKDIALDSIESPLTFYADLERHHSYISRYFLEIMYNYSKYYNHVKSKLKDGQLNYNHDHTNKSYNILNINSDFTYKENILNMLTYVAGFKVIGNEYSTSETIEYENLEKMLYAALSKVEVLENSLLRISKKLEN